MFTKRIPLVERFWRYVDKSGDCWIWTGSKSNGYGQISGDNWRERPLAAHRVSWELANGRRVPDGLCVMHSCDNPSCVNPQHLSVGTDKDNMVDASRKGRLDVASKGRLGEKHHKAKLTDEAVLEIRSVYEASRATGKRLPPGANRRLAEKFGVGQDIICEVGSGKAWSHL